MARLQAYTQQQLASSVVGVPGVDRSGEIIAGALQKVSGDFANFQIQNLQRRTAAEDSLAINAIGESRDTANIEMQQFMQANPDPATWDTGWNTIIQKQQRGFIGKTLTRDAAANERVNQKAFELEGKMKVQIAATEQTVTNSIDATGENLVKILGDPFSTDIQKEKQTKAYTDALLQRHTEEIANIMIEEVLLEGKGQEIENANKIARNFAAIDPENTIDIAQKELEARGQGKTLFPEFASMSNSDLEALKDYAGTVGNEKDGKSAEIRDETILVEQRNMREVPPGQTYDINGAFDKIDIDPDMTTEDKLTAQDEIKKNYKFWNVPTEKEVSTDTAIRAMETAVGDLANGRITKDKYWGIFADKKAELDDSDDDRYRQEAEPAYSKMIGNLKQGAGISASARIISRTEADLIEIKEKVDRNEFAKYILNAATMKDQAERINFARYNSSVLDYFSRPGNNNLSFDSATETLNSFSNTWASKDWIETYKEFKATSREFKSLERDIKNVYNAAINNLRGRNNTVELKDPWDELNDAKQARVIDMMGDGATIEEVFDAAKKGRI